MGSKTGTYQNKHSRARKPIAPLNRERTASLPSANIPFAHSIPVEELGCFSLDWPGAPLFARLVEEAQGMGHGIPHILAASNIEDAAMLRVHCQGVEPPTLEATDAIAKLAGYPGGAKEVGLADWFPLPPMFGIDGNPMPLRTGDKYPPGERIRLITKVVPPDILLWIARLPVAVKGDGSQADDAGCPAATTVKSWTDCRYAPPHMRIARICAFFQIPESLFAIWRERLEDGTIMVNCKYGQNDRATGNASTHGRRVPVRDYFILQGASPIRESLPEPAPVAILESQAEGPVMPAPGQVAIRLPADLAAIVGNHATPEACLRVIAEQVGAEAVEVQAAILEAILDH